MLSLVPAIAFHTRTPPVTEPFVLRVFELRGRFDLGPLADRIRAREHDLVVTNLVHRSYRGSSTLSPTLQDAIRSPTRRSASSGRACFSCRGPGSRRPADGRAPAPRVHADGGGSGVAEGHLVSPQLAVRRTPAAAPSQSSALPPPVPVGVILGRDGIRHLHTGRCPPAALLAADPYDQLLPSLHRIVWYSVLVVAGTFLALVDLLLLLPAANRARRASRRSRTRTSRWR